MILVTGANGHVGAEVVEQLVARGLPVRAMTRRPAAANFPAGVEVVAGDCDGGRSSHELVAAWHREDEAAVTDSGIDHTLLRPGRFMSNTLAWKHMLRRGDTVHVAFAKKTTSPIAPEDIAAVAV